MAVAAQLDLSSEERLSDAFFELHAPLRDALRTASSAEVDVLAETISNYVVDVISAADPKISTIARDEVRQLGWVADDTDANIPQALSTRLAEWDHQLLRAQTAAAARDARERSAAIRQVLAERILELIGDREMRPADIAAQLDVTRSQVSRALRQLREARRIDSFSHAGQDGRGQWYRVPQSSPASRARSPKPHTVPARVDYQIVAPGKRRTIVLRPSKRDAMAAAVEIAAAPGRGEIVIHGADGQIRTSSAAHPGEGYRARAKR